MNNSSDINFVKDQKTSKSIVRLENISKSYDGKTNTIEHFNLDIEQGTFLTILGPSGCGKTTVLRMIAGLETVSGGNVYIDNVDVTNLGAEKRQVNTVFQSYALFPHMNIFNNVAFGLRMQKVPENEIKERVMEALAMVKLDSFAERMPSQLSGGQQQRVAIARAVVNKPKVLLLDESLSALDYQLRLEMQNELKALQRKLGISFIFVTHDQEEALTMSDRIIVMNKGKIVQDGTPREIYEEPANLFVAEFIGEINVFSAKVLERIDEEKVYADVEGRKCVINTKLDVYPNKKLLVLLRPEDLIVEEIHRFDENVDGIYGQIVDLNYKGMTLDSRVKLNSGKEIVTSEFFNEDDPSMNHNIGQKVAITWHDSWEVVLDEESNKPTID
ncbi:putrescine/spermidine ABC transporter ATP-binding protein [Psittacicella hinzii]|uniref:Spermidine/putrescine import ATP-binding protein PotA n=1 Tax=Psittacicella hinzii TaxID=2028575 RepID=A0A3A1Y2E2_9GAMM|nr:spermidine/putrescine ABC transporter ATP-binding protein PotA [Psittacicella hinzii]RIY32403.1 putrescine/spermidine ABC transporter ATP-binding protein [Psittacicella hinzii]